MKEMNLLKLTLQSSLRYNPKSKLPMIYDCSTEFSEVLNTATMFGRTRSELSKVVKTAPKMIDLQLERLPGQILPKRYPKGVTSIKQIRVFVGFILQPYLKLLKIVPDPRQ